MRSWFFALLLSAAAVQAQEKTQDDEALKKELEKALQQDASGKPKPAAPPPAVAPSRADPPSLIEAPPREVPTPPPLRAAV